jgi:hypothetical protein
MIARPTVSIITSIRASPIKGRRKRRSIIKPRVKLPIRVNANARIIGRLAQEERTRNMKAPMAKSSPWAKFSTLLDLKIITKPSAESA